MGEIKMALWKYDYGEMILDSQFFLENCGGRIRSYGLFMKTIVGLF